jgi:hypothetical protein
MSEHLWLQNAELESKGPRRAKRCCFCQASVIGCSLGIGCAEVTGTRPNFNDTFFSVKTPVLLNWIIVFQIRYVPNTIRVITLAFLNLRRIPVFRPPDSAGFGAVLNSLFITGI